MPPKVVANTITALADIHTSVTSQPSTSSSDPAVFTVTPTILNKLLIALNECSEWGRVAILSALARYEAHDEKESEHICERVVPQFQHVNGSVVLGAVRVCPFTRSEEYVRDISVGDYDPHAQREARGLQQATHTQDGSTTCHPSVFSTGSAVDRAEKHQSSTTKAQRYPVQRDACIFLQV